ncbi:hypothetical protein MHU86_22933 [Fragilaria crotonensis]|nr:hypothetical protein MHU86_22933 [Fragilaria crotonensis]
MMAAESPDEFAELVAKGNQILERRPNHCLITTSTFEEVGSQAGLRQGPRICHHRSIPDRGGRRRRDQHGREAEAAGLEDILALLWASEQGMLRKSASSTKDGRGKRGRPGEREREHGNDGGLLTKHGRPPQPLSGRSRLGPTEEGNREVDPQDHGTNSARTVHFSLHRADERRAHDDGVHDEPDDEQNTSEGHQPHTVRDTDWEGTFSVGGFHKMLSNGFLSQDPNRANPGGFTIFMFHPKTVDLGSKGSRGGNELLREYLGMDVDEATLEFYMKQGFLHPEHAPRPASAAPDRARHAGTLDLRRNNCGQGPSLRVGRASMGTTDHRPQ